MRTLKFKNMTLAVDFKGGYIASLMINGKERIYTRLPLFTVCFRNRVGDAVSYTAYDAQACRETDLGAVYEGFGGKSHTVTLTLLDDGGEAAWRIAVRPASDEWFAEAVDLAPVNMPPLKDNTDGGCGGRVLYPYNEGVLISDMDRFERSWLTGGVAEYPSEGKFSVFPNMVSSQMLAYLWDDAGLYIGAHDEKRGVKEITLYKENGGVTLKFRLFCGADFGKSFETDYSLIYSVSEGRWEAAADRYRAWFEGALPEGVKPISENADLPVWYQDSPLVISYPVRGVYDMDEMKPNALYPYTNALPLIKEIKEACKSRLLVLLMHWEGTAPWAPPYVWPPYGGVENFYEFMDALHKNGDLLGVYCSGFGYTEQSNLIAEYNCEEKIREGDLMRGMCAGPDGRVQYSKICTAQRSGYDICPASEVGRKIVNDAYEPLLKSGVDYAQILDQNHGGGQYFCYSREHGHAPAPGAWMTENMQALLSGWNRTAGKMLLGCESAAAEPFIGNLLLSDNRYELNYMIGTPVPFYSYVYHRYVRNFMGNQVCCPFPDGEDTQRYRLAYSFAIGDCMTLVLTPQGELMSSWGQRDFSALPDKEKSLRLISNLVSFYNGQAKPYLYCGKMIHGAAVECATVSFTMDNRGNTVTLPAIISSTWEGEGGTRAVIAVNPDAEAQICTVEGNTVTIPPLDAVLITLK